MAIVDEAALEESQETEAEESSEKTIFVLPSLHQPRVQI
jgi:hypothetical protein